MPDLGEIFAPTKAVRPEPMSASAAAVGALLLIAAIAAPLVVLKLAPQSEPVGYFDGTWAARTTTPLVETPLNAVRTGESMTPPDPTAFAGRFAGPIVPGTGAAGIRIGAPASEVLRDLPSDIVRSVAMDRDQTLHEIRIADLSIRVATDRGHDRVARIALEARDCAGLRFHQQRWIGASLSGGLSIGSHVSRVTGHLGQPEARLPDVDPDQARGSYMQQYPGLGFDYCADSLLVRRLAVHADPRIALPPEIPALTAELDVALADTGFAGVATDYAGAPVRHAPEPGSDGAAALPSRAPALPSAVEAPTTIVPAASLPFQDPPAADRPASIAPDRPGLPFDAAPAELAGLRLAGIEAPRIPEPETPGVEMSRRQIRAAQIRLRLAGFDPQGVDGILGPNTTTAIAEFQTETGIAATGVIDAATREALDARTETAWRKWVQRQRALAAAEAARPEPVLFASAPKPRNAPECVRDDYGTIIENQSFRCDVAVLKESLSNLFGVSG